MGLFEHLGELRQRLFRSIISWIVATVIAMNFVDTLVGWLALPIRNASGGNVSLIVLSPTEAPIIYFKIALAGGFALALPFILYQIYGFVAPGLYPNERSILLLGIPAAMFFFILGAMFTLQLLIPFGLPMLMGFLGTVVQPTYSLENYLGFVTTLVVWMGLLFQTPLIIYVIARLGVVTPKQLGSARRSVWFGAVLFAAIVTPTHDPITMLMATVPFIVLYELGIVFARVAVKQRRKAVKDYV